ncbi:MAG: hypothetical protein GQ537_01600 [Gammaproteobacteria bacterium]|nr:hypothetical protein [Gammaproteobacteria bacterium]
MLDHILRTAQAFENTHGIAPEVIYINPSHYESLCRYYSEIFLPDQDVCLGFRLVILPGSMLIHPEAALLSATRQYSQVA